MMKNQFLRTAGTFVVSTVIVALLFTSYVKADCTMGAQANCTAAAFRAGLVAQGCITKNRQGDGTECANDPCAGLSTRTLCVESPQCSPVPIGSVGCTSSQLLCWSLNETQCALRRYCSWTATGINSYCNYTLPVTAPAVARAAELSDNCPAIHPVVLAILIIMFVTLLIAIGIVLGVVVLNKKKQDELEREEEEAEAEEAIGRL